MGAERSTVYVDHRNRTSRGMPASPSIPSAVQANFGGKTIADSIAEGPFLHVYMLLTADLTLVSATGGAAKAGGVQILDLGTGLLWPVKSRVKGSFKVTGTGNSTAGEIGLGTVVATGAVAVLGGTPTFENILEGGVPALGNATAGGADVTFATGDLNRAEIGSVSTAPDVFVNAASTFAAGTGAFVLNAGTEIDLWFAQVDNA